MIRQWQIFLLAVQFLTRLPVPRDLPFSEERLTEATKFFPLVGLVIGALGAAAYGLGVQLFPPVVAALLSTAVTIAATGAFHEDGLADAADGLGGGMSRDRALEIMRDSRIGTYGAVTLGLTLAIKITALAALPVSVTVVTLLLGHAISRYPPVLVIRTCDYAREVGAKFAAPTISASGHRLALLLALAALGAHLSAIGPAALAGAGAGALLAWGMARLYLRRLGGYTGDCLGATQQMAELGLVLGVLAWP